MKRKTITKRLLSLAIAMVMIATTLVGCGNGGNGSGGNSKNSKLVKEQAEKYADVTDVKEITNGVKLTIAVPGSDDA